MRGQGCIHDRAGEEAGAVAGQVGGEGADGLGRLYGASRDGGHHLGAVADTAHRVALGDQLIVGDEDNVAGDAEIAGQGA